MKNKQTTMLARQLLLFSHPSCIIPSKGKQKKENIFVKDTPAE